MKLLELEITNVRGIRHMVLTPQGKNLLVVGRNGVGKSSIVDAIDFLLTGRIARLTGTGTKNISLASAGPMLGCRTEQAVVAAVVSIDDGRTKIAFSRCMADPQQIICADTDRACLEGLLAVTGKGQTVLARRNILQYVAETAGDRALQINDLLNLRDIESLRRVLVETAHRCDRELQTANAVERTAGETVLSTIGQTVLNQANVLAYVNVQRQTLGASPLTGVRSSEMKIGAVPPSGPALKKGTDLEGLRSAATSLSGLLQSAPRSLAEYPDKFNAAIDQLNQSKPILVDAKALQLTRLGLEVMGDGDSCPLCETPWPHSELRNTLAARIQRAGIQAGRLRQIDDLYGRLTDDTTQLIRSCKRFLEQAAPIEARSSTADLERHMANLESFVQRVNEAHERLLPLDSAAAKLDWTAEASDLEQYVRAVLAKANEEHYEASPAQVAWDRLTRLEQSLGSWENAKLAKDLASFASLRAQSLLDSFVLSRDTVLGELYQAVQARFVELYRGLHTANEPAFTASLEPNNAGLDLSVNFLGRVMAPPLAYHSEGHQDSMGICLYLALAEHVSMNKVRLTVLDDVVMSVDADHRRELCALLRDRFPGHQFILTTHDRTWAMQLQDTGVVAHQECIQLTNWTPETGPYDGPLDDLWLTIEAALATGDVRGAAPVLRRGAEEFLQTVCEALHAKVVFRKSASHDLGELQPAALEQYKYLLRRAKVSAELWGKSEVVAQVQELESIRTSVSRKVQKEEGNINPVVHYNEWEDLSPNDFRPVVAAYHDLHDLFFCPVCESVLQVLPDRGAPQSLRCKCCKTDLNLASRP